MASWHAEYGVAAAHGNVTPIALVQLQVFGLTVHTAINTKALIDHMNNNPLVIRIALINADRCYTVRNDTVTLGYGQNIV